MASSDSKARVNRGNPGMARHLERTLGGRDHRFSALSKSNIQVELRPPPPFFLLFPGGFVWFGKH